VNASVLMQVDARIAWEVLSDYDHLARFIPDMKTSRVVSRDGTVSWWNRRASSGSSSTGSRSTWCSKWWSTRCAGSTRRRISGNIRDLQTRYDLTASDAGVKLDYTGRFIPEFSVPLYSGLPMVRRVVERRFRAMVEEIARRDALARDRPKD